MVIDKKSIVIVTLSLIFSLYGFYLTNYFIEISTSGDIIKYKSLWENLQFFELNSLKKLAAILNH